MSLHLPPRFKDNPVRAQHPRQLMLYERNPHSWNSCVDKATLIGTDYLAISYRQSDFQDRDQLKKIVREACYYLGLSAYWIDFECIGETQDEKNVDLYRIADVFSYATKTLILINGDDDSPQSKGWLSWGGRVWTLPEALLSEDMYYKAGSRPIQRITLKRAANYAYKDIKIDEEAVLINHFGTGGRNALDLAFRASVIADAIWRRSSTSLDTSLSNKTHDGEFIAYPAERVYAMMGLLPYRITPNEGESEEVAYKRLMEINRITDYRFPWENGTHRPNVKLINQNNEIQLDTTQSKAQAIVGASNSFPSTSIISGNQDSDVQVNSDQILNTRPHSYSKSQSISKGQAVTDEVIGHDLKDYLPKPRRRASAESLMTAAMIKDTSGSEWPPSDSANIHSRSSKETLDAALPTFRLYRVAKSRANADSSIFNSRTTRTPEWLLYQPVNRVFDPYVQPYDYSSRAPVETLRGLPLPIEPRPAQILQSSEMPVPTFSGQGEIQNFRIGEESFKQDERIPNSYLRHYEPHSHFRDSTLRDLNNLNTSGQTPMLNAENPMTPVGISSPHMPYYEPTQGGSGMSTTHSYLRGQNIAYGMPSSLAQPYPNPIRPTASSMSYSTRLTSTSQGMSYFNSDEVSGTVNTETYSHVQLEVHTNAPDKIQHAASLSSANTNNKSENSQYLGDEFGPVFNGDVLYKCARKKFGKGHTRKRHMRYFWINQHLKQLSWSKDPPTVTGSRHKLKSVVISSFEDVADRYALSNGMHERSIIFATPPPIREIKVTAHKKEKHDLWMKALKSIFSTVIPPAVSDASQR